MSYRVLRSSRNISDIDESQLDFSSYRISLPSLDFEALRSSYSQVEIYFFTLLSITLLITFVWLFRRSRIRNNNPSQVVDALQIDDILESATITSLSKEEAHYGINTIKKIKLKKGFFRAFSRQILQEMKEVDTIFNHFLLAIMLIIDALIELYNLTGARSSIQNITDSMAMHQIRKKIEGKSRKELLDILKGKHATANLNKDELINIFISNKDAIKLLEIEERRQILMNKSNKDLRLVLKGVPNISRMNKSQLVDKILLFH